INNRIVWCAVLQNGQDGILAVGGNHLIPATFQRARERACECYIVFHDQQLAFNDVLCQWSSPFSSLMADRGRDRVTDAPPDGRFCAVMLPPRVRATLTERNRPSPPPGLPLLEL